MFSAQPSIDKFSNPDHNHKSLFAPLPESSHKKMVNELQTWAAHDLEELLCLKAKQIKKYGHELS